MAIIYESSTVRPVRPVLEKAWPPRLSRRARAERYAVVISWAALVGVNAGAKQLFPNDVREVEQDSPKLLIDPAPGAFAIWGPIFAGLGALSAYQATAGTHNPNLARARVPLTASFLCGALWPAAIGYRQKVLATGLLFGMLAGAGLAYQRLRARKSPPDPAEVATTRVPLSLYLGWLSLAGILSVAGNLVDDFGFPRPNLGWTAAGIGLASTVGIAFGVTQRDWAHNAAIAWGLGGIAVNQRKPEVTRLVAGAIGGLAAGLFAGWWRSRHVHP